MRGWRGECGQRSKFCRESERAKSGIMGHSWAHGRKYWTVYSRTFLRSERCAGATFRVCLHSLSCAHNHHLVPAAAIARAFAQAAQGRTPKRQGSADEYWIAVCTSAVDVSVSAGDNRA